MLRSDDFLSAHYGSCLLTSPSSSALFGDAIPSEPYNIEGLYNGNIFPFIVSSSLDAFIFFVEAQ